MEVGEQESTKGRVLVIGVGSHRVSDPGEKRYYLDIDVDLLRMQERNRARESNTVEADATKPLPYGSLIRSLAEPEGSLWSEIARVLTNEGEAVIVTEVNYRNSLGEILVAEPHLKAKKAAEAQGLKVEVEQLSKDELSKIDTEQPMVLRYLLNKKTPEKSPFYRVVAKKVEF